MWRKHLLSLSMTMLLGIFLGAGIGFLRGQRQLEQAWDRIEHNPSSIQGDPGAYLCVMGYSPLYGTVTGATLGAILGLGGGLYWLRFQKEPLTT